MSKTHLMPFLFKHPISTRINGGVEQFSLTDIWKLSGMGDEKRPSKWLRSEHAQKQIAYLEFLADIKGRNSALLNGHFCPIENGKGRYAGTWAIKELAISFAMWLSPEYHVEVVKGFAEYEEAKRSRRNIKGLHKNVTDALRDTRAEQGKETRHFHYSNEAKMINSIIVGMNYRDWLKLNDLEDASFRDALTPEQLDRLEELEKYDAFLIEEGVEYPKRKEKLEAKNNRIIVRKIKSANCKKTPGGITASQLRKISRTPNTRLWRTKN
ncbi:TPA: KilA-N domain-containing protein [Escherichia coli]|nr:KilA-N domain-containing protein [Escherichia coli]